jgi:fucose permease
LSGTAFSIALFIALAGNTILNFLMGLLSEAFGLRSYPIILLASLFFLILLLANALRKNPDKSKIR